MSRFATSATVLKSYLFEGRRDPSKRPNLKRIGDTWVVCDPITGRPEIELGINDRAFGQPTPQFLEINKHMCDATHLRIDLVCYEIGLLMTFSYNGRCSYEWIIGDLVTIGETLSSHVNPDVVDTNGCISSTEFLRLLARCHTRRFRKPLSNDVLYQAPYRMKPLRIDGKDPVSIGDLLQNHPIHEEVTGWMVKQELINPNIPPTPEGTLWCWLNYRPLTNVYLLPPNS